MHICEYCQASMLCCPYRHLCDKMKPQMNKQTEMNGNDNIKQTGMNGNDNICDLLQPHKGDPDCSPSGLIKAALSGDDMGGSVAFS